MDKNATRHIAKLARLHFEEGELESISNEMSGILKWVDMLQTADTTAADKISDDETPLRTREDIVTAGNISEALIENAPEPYEHFFTVPKMVE